MQDANSGFALRWAIIRDPSKTMAARAFALAEMVLLPLSFVTFGYVVLEAVLGRFGASLAGHMPSWLSRWALPVLVAAAIGYVTNWLAILMLFKPYEKHKWLFVWPQGLLPRNKANMAREIGNKVGTELLPPKALIDEFEGEVRGYLSRPEVMERMQQMVKDNEAAYIRVSRNPSEDVYAADTQFEFNKAKTVCEGNDATIIACGEFVSTAKKAAGLLKEKGINVRVLDMYCIKPIDKETIIKAAGETGNIITIEEHSVIGGLGSMVASVVTENCPCKMKILGLPDEELICGSQTEIFEHENLTPQGVADEVIKLIKK